MKNQKFLGSCNDPEAVAWLEEDANISNIAVHYLYNPTELITHGNLASTEDDTILAGIMNSGSYSDEYKELMRRARADIDSK